MEKELEDLIQLFRNAVTRCELSFESQEIDLKTILRTFKNKDVLSAYISEIHKQIGIAEWAKKYGAVKERPENSVIGIKPTEKFSWTNSGRTDHC